MKDIYLDSNVFIQASLRKNPHAIKVLYKLSQNKYRAITSVLSWDEIVYIMRKFHGQEIAKEQGKKFLNFPYLTIIDAKKEIILKAQKIIEKYDLQARDAIHISTALASNCKTIVSEDSDFKKVKELKILHPRDI